MLRLKQSSGMPIEDSAAVLVARFLKSNNYENVSTGRANHYQWLPSIIFPLIESTLLRSSATCVGPRIHFPIPSSSLLIYPLLRIPSDPRRLPRRGQPPRRRRLSAHEKCPHPRAHSRRKAPIRQEHSLHQGDGPGRSRQWLGRHITQRTEHHRETAIIRQSAQGPCRKDPPGRTAAFMPDCECSGPEGERAVDGEGCARGDWVVATDAG